MLKQILALLCVLTATSSVAETGCKSNETGFRMSDAPLASGDFVGAASSSFTARGAEIALDTNRDGKLEVAAVSQTGNVILFEGIRFAPSAATPGGVAAESTRQFASKVSGVTAVHFGDMDGDRAADLLLATPTRMFIFFNDGTGGFGGQLSSSATEITSIALADFNGDGKLDIATADGLSVKTIKGNGSRTGLSSWSTAVGLGSSFLFTSPIELRATYPSTKRLPGLAIGGAGDGFLLYSLLVVDSASTPSSIRFSASTSRAFSNPSAISSLESAEVTGDTFQDLIAIRNDSAQLALLRNTGTTYTQVSSKQVSSKSLPYSHLTALGSFTDPTSLSILASSPLDRNLKLFKIVNNDLQLQGTQTTAGEILHLATPLDVDNDGDLDGVGLGTYEGKRFLTLVENRRIKDTCQSKPVAALPSGETLPVW